MILPGSREPANPAQLGVSSDRPVLCGVLFGGRNGSRLLSPDGNQMGALEWGDPSKTSGKVKHGPNPLVGVLILTLVKPGRSSLALALTLSLIHI